MARVVLSEGAFADLDRFFEFLAANDLDTAAETSDLILDALKILSHHPLIGRPVEQDMRELVISRGRTGYVALYKFQEADDVVLVVAIRHQREAGFPG